MDRTSLKQKLKGILTGKAGIAAGFVGVGVMALTAGLHFGKGGADADHDEVEAAEESHASAEAHHGGGHEAAGHGEAHAKADAHGDAHGAAPVEAKHDAHASAKHDDSHDSHVSHGDTHAAAKHDEHGAKAEAHGEAKHDAHASAKHENSHDTHGDTHAAAKHDEHGAKAEAHGDAHAKADAHAAPKHARKKHLTWTQKLFGTYAQAWTDVQEKIDAVRGIDLENERLRLENTHLRTQLEGLQFSYSSKDASHKTRTIEYKLDKETGSHVGRDLASIAYRVPTNLIPSQLHTLGVSYFKAREDEKAAVIFTFLSGLDDNDTFKTPRDFLLTGIAWYRLDNFATADRYFDRALKAPANQDNLQTLAHARMWKALSAQRVGKHTQSQFWLTELVDHHPLSVEASWVNSKGGPRPKAPEAHRGIASDGED